MSICFLELLPRARQPGHVDERTGLLAANGINMRKFLVRVGTAYGLLIDMVHIAHEFCIGELSFDIIT